MKKRLLKAGLLSLSLLSLASCGMLDDVTSTASDNTSVQTTNEETKYEMLDSQAYVWTDSINSKWIKMVVPVKNTGNTNLYLNDISIDIESSSGKLLDSKSYINGYPEVIKPGEIGYYYDETTINFTDTTVKLVPHLDVEKAKFTPVRYNVSDIDITDTDYMGAKIVGRVENNTSSDGTLVYVVANLFDADDKLISSCFTILDDTLKAGAKVGFNMMPYSYRDFKAEDVKRYETYAYPTEFNW